MTAGEVTVREPTYTGDVGAPLLFLTAFTFPSSEESQVPIHCWVNRESQVPIYCQWKERVIEKSCV